MRSPTTTSLPAPVRAPADDRTVQLLRAADLLAKLVLVTMLVLVVLDPTYGNLEGKAPVARAVVYPLLAFGFPLVWHLRHRGRGDFPWGADLALTAVCFSDILGNRLDLYDQVVWFDDWMHLQNTALVAGAVVWLQTDRAATFWSVLERALGVGLGAALAWELFEYASFVTRSSELPSAYPDTLGDLSMGGLGCVLAAWVVHIAHSTGHGRPS